LAKQIDNKPVRLIIEIIRYIIPMEKKSLKWSL